MLLKLPKELWIEDLEQQKRLKQTFSPAKTCVSTFMRLQIDGRWPGLEPLKETLHAAFFLANRINDQFSVWNEKSLHQVLNEELERYLSVLGPAADLKYV